MTHVREADSVGVLAAACAALLVDSLLYSVVVPVLPSFAARFDVGATGISLFYAAYAVALLAATPVAGVVGDRIGHRRPFLVGGVGLVGATVVFALADSFGALLAARAFQGLAAGALWTSGIALLVERTAAHRLGGALGAAISAMSVGMIAGPPLGGLLAGAFGDSAVFVVCAGATLVLVAALPWLVPPRPAAPRGTPPAGSGLVPTRRVLPVLAVVALGAATLSLLEPLLPISLSDRYGLGAASIGLIFGAATLAHGLVGVPVGVLSDRRPGLPLIPAGLLSMAAILPFLSRSGVWRTAALLVAFAVGFGFLLVPALRRLVASERNGAGEGAVVASFNIAYAVGMMAGPLLAGIALTVVSLDALLTGVALVLACSGVLFLRGQSQLRVTDERTPR